MSDNSQADEAVDQRFTWTRTIGWTSVGLVAAIATAWLGSASVWSGLLAVAVLYLLCYVPARALFHAHDRRPDVFEAIVYLVLGLAGLAVLSILAMCCHLPPELAAVPASGVTLWFFVRRRGPVLPAVATPRKLAAALLAGFVAATYVAMPLIGSVHMGVGDYPRVFYTADAAYYLMQARSLAAEEEYPPPNLGFLGARFEYHYGTQMMAAALTRLSGLRPHTSMFLVLLPLLRVGTCAAAFLLVRRLSVDVFPHWVGLSVVLFLGSVIARVVSVYLACDGPASFIPALLSSSIAFNHQFPMVSSEYGVLTAFVALWCMRRIDEPQGRWLLVYSVGILVHFKSPYFVGLGLGLAVWSLHEGLRHGRWSPMGTSLAALALAVMTKLAMVGAAANAGARTGPELVFCPGCRLGGSISFLTNRAGDSSALWFLLAAIGVTYLAAKAVTPYILPVLVVRAWRRKPANVSWVLSLWGFLALPVVFVNLFAVQAAPVPGAHEVREYNFNTAQVATLIRYVAPAMLLGFIVPHWTFLAARHRAVLVAVVVISVVPSVLHSWYGFVQAAVTKRYGPEFVENAELAEALRVIPTDGSVLVTNELRYQGWTGEQEGQFQVPAIFGHQCYAGIFAYGGAGSHPDARLRWEQQARLRQPEWDSVVLRDAERHGWTHLLIDVTASHPATVPLPLRYETDRFHLYQFPTVDRRHAS